MITVLSVAKNIGLSGSFVKMWQKKFPNFRFLTQDTAVKELLTQYIHHTIEKLHKVHTLHTVHTIHTVHAFHIIEQELRMLFSISEHSLDFPSYTVQLSAYLCLIDGTIYLVMAHGQIDSTTELNDYYQNH